MGHHQATRASDTHTACLIVATDLTERIARIRENVSIVNLLLSYGVDLKKIGSGYSARCISHDDHTPSMSVYNKNGIMLCYCHVCGFGNDVIDAYKKLTGASTM